MLNMKYVYSITWFVNIKYVKYMKYVYSIIWLFV